MSKSIIVLLLIFLLSYSYALPNYLEQIAEQINILAEQLGTAVVTPPTIVSNNDFINLDAIADYADNINEENLCLSLGVFSESDEWIIDEAGTRLEYVGEGYRDVKFFIVCDEGRKILRTLKEHPHAGINMEYVSHCTQFNTDSSEPMCAIILSESIVPSAKEEIATPYIVFFIFMLILIWPMLLLFKSKNYYLKAIYLLKVIVFLIVSILFSNFLTEVSLIFNLVLLFFFFFESNLTIASILLGFLDNEEKHIKLANFAVLSLELLLLLFVLLLIAPIF